MQNPSGHSGVLHNPTSYGVAGSPLLEFKPDDLPYEPSERWMMFVDIRCLLAIPSF